MAPVRTRKSIEVSVKSSLRTLQILEYCDSVQRSVTIVELASQLGFPQSSTSTLVQSMINAGYLVVDRDGRQIYPSSRVAALGTWIAPAISQANIRSLMLALGEKTGQTILLGVPSDLCVRYIDMVPGRHAMRLDIPVGTRLPLTESGMGRLLLSEMPDNAVVDIWKSTRTRVKAGGARAIHASEISNIWNANPVVSPLDTIMKELSEIRSCGYAISLGRVTFGAGIICFALPRRPLEQPIGLGIGGLSAIIERDKRSILKIVNEEALLLGIKFEFRNPIRTKALRRNSG